MSAALDEAIGKITFCLGETIKCLANRLGTLQYQILRIEQALNACNQDSVFWHPIIALKHPNRLGNSTRSPGLMPSLILISIGMVICPMEGTAAVVTGGSSMSAMALFLTYTYGKE
jgi:hypothetical protein